MRIGILAVQGAFCEHESMLRQLGIETFLIRQKKDIEAPFDGLIIPGGESTVMGKLLVELGLFYPLKQRIENGLPVFGTCAGLILLAKDVFDDKAYLQTMDICVKRNAYGRQLGSFLAVDEFLGIGEIPMTFIRGPYIESVGKGVTVLAVVEHKIVAARQGKHLVTAFHPELSDNNLVHKYFLKMINDEV